MPAIGALIAASVAYATMDLEIELARRRLERERQKADDEALRLKKALLEALRESRHS